ncbi:hydantoinase/oxoprolinase family protein [Phenylobacterium sp. VNQ135]|uniref:hydantoinase/oxoprolinase family protein n=1 Tax=Phenylobacterium sp. VNQ135 TaxID=3400922 RepID=UPI003C022414
MVQVTATRPTADRPPPAVTGDLIIATDVGGTCTDTVIFQPDGGVVLGKRLSTPPDYAAGVLDSVRSAAEAKGLDLETLFARTRLFIHGSTVVDNTVFERAGARTGLVTTEGFEDTLLITRGAYGRWGGLSEDRLKHPVHTDRAPPLVPGDRIAGVPERVDYKGAVIRPLDEAATERALRRLIDQGAEAIAVSFLWSFKAPEHERAVRDILARIAPEAYCTLSSDIAPAPGEYERTSTAVINAYAGRVVRDYLTDLEGRLSAHGYAGPLMVMQGYGGLLPAAQAADRAIGMLECGPAAGVIGSRALGEVLGQPNIIAADMGGTTFKVSVIQNGTIEYALEPMVDRFHYTQPKIEVVSIGAGGGSIISLEADSLAPRVGPRSAGSRPGPACYGLGGDEPTLTDVFMLVGYMDPSVFLGGAMTLDPEAARQVFARKVAEPMGRSVEAAAIGVYKVAAAQITDLVHEITVERGLDPRDFVLHVFGGSCGMLAGAFATELGLRRFVLPYTASVNCAFGLISADVAHEYMATRVVPVPADPDEIEAIFAPMAAEGRRQLASEGFTPDRMAFERSIDLRYGRQVNELRTVVSGDGPIDAGALEALAGDFEALYERRFGKGSAYREAGIEMTRFRLTARGLLDRAAGPSPTEVADGEAAVAAPSGVRRAYSVRDDAMIDMPLFDFEHLTVGAEVRGPAIVHTPITTLVLQAGQVGRLDGRRNIIVDQD